MREDETANPADIGLLRPSAVIEPTHALANGFEQFWLETGSVALKLGKISSPTFDNNCFWGIDLTFAAPTRTATTVLLPPLVPGIVNKQRNGWEEPLPDPDYTLSLHL